ncbi:putative toxin-antitoxin system toxin component, PIN family [Azohydromonas caseinilytica]|uniref:Putative toxin-antitoxin system toxin component, PIN family n=1 Tax=Azohydromonas caseinilytica TaxID=2728836 RepID=A0A848F3R5_9BURK|nr:putative toxin-antitoxin system toxin component, PIN family [Azohydromonas caseinilytica]NML14032.1 putative toxin-antitoxin system toxin component, PIN family [Azohydromonas caseinilytica]
MRIVLDTNVALSALLWRGTPYRLLATIRQRGDVQLYSSAALLTELADVLSRPSIAKRLALIGRSARDVLSDYVEAVEVVEPQAVPRVVPNDADDDHVIAAAVASHADAIVSGDTDLLSMGRHEGIQIIDAAQALDQIAP